MRNRLCLQRLVSVAKFTAERGLMFRDDENVGSPKNFFQKFFQNFFQAKLRKRCDVSGDRFCSSFTSH